MILIKQHEQNSWENNQFSSLFWSFWAYQMIFIRRWSFPSGNGIADVQISLFSLSTSNDFLETAAEKDISTFSSYYGDFNLIWFYDNWENSICWWRSCMINRSLTATKKTLWRVFFCFFCITITAVLLSEAALHCGFWHEMLADLGAAAEEAHSHVSAGLPVGKASHRSAPHQPPQIIALR